VIELSVFIVALRSVFSYRSDNATRWASVGVAQTNSNVANRETKMANSLLFRLYSICLEVSVAHAIQERAGLIVVTLCLRNC